MSYKLEKPYTEFEYANFIVNYSHNKGLKIEYGSDVIYALEKNEIMQNGHPIINPDYEKQLQAERKQNFEREFFYTSLGWIRRKVSMKDGSIKDFLSDLLLPIKAGLESGVEVKLITYMEPDFELPLTKDYLESLQLSKNATSEFVNECLKQIVQDFGNGG